MVIDCAFWINGAKVTLIVFSPARNWDFCMVALTGWSLSVMLATG